MSEWKSASHNKYLLQYHLIFVCKYRKKLLVSQNIADDVKRLSTEICNKHKVNIKYMETEKMFGLPYISRKITVSARSL